MQWNVHGNLGNSASINSSEAKAIARIVNYNQPDIITFNELEDVGASDTDISPNTAAMISWVTNNLPYFGNKTGVTFWVDIATVSDNFIRNGSISRYPISGAHTYSDAGTLGGTNYFNLRGMESFKVQLSGTNALQIFHVHLKCCSDYPSCPRKQSEADIDATNMMNWASTNLFPYIFTGDCNEDEGPAHECTITSTYHPITTLKEGGKLVEYLPKTLAGGTLTWDSPSPNIRFDYVLPATNRISLTPSSTAVCITTGIVFNSSVWGSQYTSVIPGSSTSDSSTASDHLCVQVTYFFPTSVTNFNVTPTNVFTSSGSPGGPFSPSSQVYTLTNSDTIPLFWSVTKTSSWLTVSTLATNLTLGAGQSTNITAFITNSVANSLPPGTYLDTINFSNTATGVSIPRGVTLTVNTLPPSASFTGSPTNGTNSVTVTFTDTSTGTITNRFWDFGDSGTTNVTTNSVAHAYVTGTYTVTLIASGPLGASTNTKPNYITVLASPSTILADAGNLFDSLGTTTNNLAPTNSVAVLVVDTGTNGFVDPQPTFLLSPGAIWGTDDKVVGLWDLSACGCGDGQLFDQTVVAYTNGIAPGQKLQLYWFPSLTLASTTLGVTYYGRYTDTNSPPLDGSDPWQMPAGGSSVQLNFLTTFWDGSNPESAGEATFSTAAPLTAFESWQIQYFGDTNDAAAASSTDPDGDGQNNLAEFLSGTDPTNNVSSLRITAVAEEGNDVRLTWMTANGKTNAVQASAGAFYTTNFVDISPSITILGSGDPITNYLDVGAASNAPSRYYRIRLVQ